MISLLENTRRPDITFHSNGKILISARVSRLLGLRRGDSINIAFHDGECLLFACRHENQIGRHMAQCYPSKKGGGHYCANSVALCRAMLVKACLQVDRAAFMVGQPDYSIADRVCLPIIYKCPL